MKLNEGRAAGILYFLIIVFSLIAQIFVRDGLVDYSNAHITAQNLLANESWYRFGFVSELLMLICDIGVTTFLYLYFKKYSVNLATISTFFRLVSISILSVTALSHYAAIPLIKDPIISTGLTFSQTETLALVFIKLHGVGYNISLLFFGFHLLCLGFIMYQFPMFNKWMGFLLGWGGVCYILNSIVWFQFPSLVHFIYPVILIPCASGEWIFCGFLIAKGAKLEK